MKCSFPIAEHDVHLFQMEVIASNMYVLIDKQDALVVDPIVSHDAEKLLREYDVRECTILLTHEHFDHISGVNRLRELFNCTVICTKTCAEMIPNPRKNAAAFFTALFLDRTAGVQQVMERLIDTKYSCTADVSYEGVMEMQWHGIPIELKEIKGHSLGSQIITMSNIYVFAGDNLVPGEKIITRLPGGNKEVVEAEVKPFLRGLRSDSMIFPGHGEVMSILEGAAQYCISN